MQEMLDFAESKLKENSQEFDELFDLTVKLCKDYKKLLEYSEEHFPEASEKVKERDFSELGKHEKNANLYQKSYRMKIIK